MLISWFAYKRILKTQPVTIATMKTDETKVNSIFFLKSELRRESSGEDWHLLHRL